MPVQKMLTDVVRSNASPMLLKMVPVMANVRNGTASPHVKAIPIAIRSETMQLATFNWLNCWGIWTGGVADMSSLLAHDHGVPWNDVEKQKPAPALDQSGPNELRSALSG